MSYITNLKFPKVFVSTLTLGSATEYGYAHPTGLWTDLVQPAAGVNSAGSAAPPTISDADGFLEFAGGSADNILSGQWQLEHGWKSGTNVSPHMHILCNAATNSSAGANTALFGMDYKIYGAASGQDNAAFASLVNVSVTVSPLNANSRPVMQLISLGTIDMTGYQDSAIIAWRLTRY